VGIYDNLSRDPRDHNISAAYTAELLDDNVDWSSGNKRVVKVKLADIDQIVFAFPDHKRMILDACKI